MTILVWANGVLAVDRAGVIKNTKHSLPKFHLKDDEVIVGVGHATLSAELVDWYLNNRNKPYPTTQHAYKMRAQGLSADLFVAKLGHLLRFEDSEIPIDHHLEKCAFGDGADFAYGALAMSATATQAVSIAEEYCTNCGGGADVFYFSTKGVQHNVMDWFGSTQQPRRI